MDSNTAHIGFGTLDLLPGILAERGAKRVLLVVGPHSFHASGADSILPELQAVATVEVYEEGQRNPTVESVAAAFAFAQRSAPEVVVAIGGGSVIDTAKMVAYSLTNTPDLPKDGVDALPIIAVPTTAGTGSEATRFATFYRDRKKESLKHASLLPSVALVDPALLRSLSQEGKAGPAMDALSQAVEALWSVNATPVSDTAATYALSRLRTSLVPAVTKGDDESLLALAAAAHESGVAINISFTTAAHALSYPLTSRFGIAHGHAVALLLPSLIRYNALVSEGDVVDPRGVTYVQEALARIYEVLQVPDAEAAARLVEGYMDAIGLPRTLRTFGVDKAAIPGLVAEASLERLANNPRRIREEDAAAILAGIL